MAIFGSKKIDSGKRSGGKKVVFTGKRVGGVWQMESSLDPATGRRKKKAQKGSVKILETENRRVRTLH